MAQFNRGKLPARNGKMRPTLSGTHHGIVQPKPSKHKAHVEARLEPPPSNALVGFEPHIARLVRVLNAPQAPWIASIEGADGMGKTTLADAIVRHAIERNLYADIAWVRAPIFQLKSSSTLESASPDTPPALSAISLTEQLLQQLMPESMRVQHCSHKQLFGALQSRLRAKPHLIVVDNLKTAADVSSLLPTLKELANPSVFLLTTHINPAHAPHVHRFPMPALCESDALQLVRREAQLRNLPELAARDDNQLCALLDTVGGHPLALRLMVGHVHAQPLASLLDELHPLRGQAITERYTSLFHHAWRNLNEQMQHTMLLMPLINPRGESLDYLAAVLGWGLDAMHAALEPLVMRNLIEARQSTTQRGSKITQYSIHTLTHKFLQQQIIRLN